MAMTKTTTIRSINVTYSSTDPVVHVESIVKWDDPDDSDLPIEKNESRVLHKVTQNTSYDSETGEPTTTETVTDYSGEDSKVIAICDAVWS